MNRTILFIIILIFASLISMGVVWYVYKKPIAITGYVNSKFPKPQYQPPIIPPGASTTTPTQAPAAPVDSRSWGERMLDPVIPDVPGVVWQIYRNKKYGFQMEYPVDWNISRRILRTGEVQFNFFSNTQIIDETNSLFNLSLSKGDLREEILHNSDWAEKINKKGFIPDAEINGNKIFIRDAGLSSYDNYPYMLLQKDSLIYGFGQGWGNGNENNGIIEHMIKSFHFLK